MSTKLLIDATAKSLELTEGKLKEAEDVATAAQTAWVDAETAASVLRDDVSAISAALSVLKGEAPPETRELPSKPAEPVEEDGDDFEKRMRQERKAKKQKLYSEGPYAGLKCGGCGTVGSMYDGVQTMGKSGRTTPILACHECSSVKRR